MRKTRLSRFLSLVLALVMVLSMLPAPAFATETATYTQITSADELTTGKYVMAVSTGYAPSVLSGSWVLAEALTAADGTVTDPASTLVWDITVDGSTVKLTDSNGVTIAPKGGNNNGISSGDYSWAVTCTDGTFQFAGQGEDTVVLASNVGSENKFRGYKTTTVSGNPNGYPSDFTLYKLADDAGTTDPSEPVETDPIETEPAQLPSYTVSDTIAAGDVVLLYNAGSGTVLTSTASGYKLAGEAVTAADGVISADISAAEWTVGINEDGTYTFTQGELALGMVQSGSYVNLSTNAADGYTAWTVEDGTGENVHYLRNTNMAASNYGPYYLEYYSGYTAYASSSPSDSAYGIEFYVLTGETVTPDPEPTDPTDPVEPEPTDPVETEAPIADGDKVVIYAPAYSKALSTEKTGYYNVGEDITVENGVVTGYTESAVFTVIANEDGSFSFEQNGQNLGLAASFSSMDLGAVNDDWNLVDLGGGLYNVQNTVRGNYIEWYNSYSNWSTYNSSSAATDDQFQLSFFVIREEGIVSELHEGDTVVIFNPANLMALSTEYSGYYNAGTAVTLTDGKLSGYTAADVWTVGVNEDGSYTFSTAAGQKLSLGASFSSMPLDDVNPNWNVTAAATEGCFYIQNTARGNYIEWYADKNNWSSYYNIGSNEALFAQQFYLVVDGVEAEGGLPENGEQVVIYNLAAEGVLAAENDAQSIENALATVENGAASPANGGVVFTVSLNGNYYRFYNETYGYLCSNGTGNNAFYSLEASEDADWTLTEGKSGGYNMESRTAKYNGTYSQYLEYYADSYKTYSMYNVTDYDIYEFFFYPVAEVVSVTEGIVNVPDVVFLTTEPAYLGQDYVYTFAIDAVFGVQTLNVTVMGEAAEYTLANDVYTVVVTADQIATFLAENPGLPFAISISGTDAKGVEFANGSAVDIIDEPSIGTIAPAANSQTGENKRPVISAEIINAGEGAAVVMTVNGETVEAVYADGTITWTPAADMADGRVSVTVTVTRADGKTAVKSWSFTVGEAQFELYFGQLHSHTTYSDGSGSLESALEYIANLPESANVDFVAFTDHSNYFDTSSSANPEQALYDMSLASSSSQELWNAYKNAVAEFNASQSDVIAIGGFEMTWSGGPGHINTFATNGIVSRNNTTLNNKTSDAGMKAYYALISQAEGVDSISQFNHPGTTFGNFSDFAYWDALVDTRMYLVEVGNGEGQIGAGGYYPSYEQYTMALDKGWHVAPTNNQDNHKGKWGNANDARDVVLTDDFSEEGIYAAIRAYRVYATEDKNLEIGYTVNGMVLGSIIEEVPEILNVEVTLYDPDASDSVSKVEVIVNSGKVAYTWDDPAELTTGLLTATLAPDYSYYYLRVTQGDGDIAVTAPVWVGETLKLGISAVECGTSTPVTGEELTISTTLFNSETSDATVKSLTYTVGDLVLAVDNTGYTIPASGNTTVDFAYTPDVAKVMNVTVTVVVELDGVEYTFSMDVELDVQDASKLVYIGIDASHYNEYVNGNYKDSMGNFGNLAAEYSVRTVTLNTSEDLIAACSNEKYVALILTAPSRRSAEAQAADPLKVYTDEEKAAINAFNQAGGTVILAGWSDHYENYPAVESIANMEAFEHMAATQNDLLAALGSSLRIGDDATYDDDYNGGQAYRLYFNAYNFDSFLVDGVEVDDEHPHDRLYTEVYSHYGGASVYTADGTLPETVTPIVFGHSGTYSVDVDGDGLGGETMPKYTYAEGDDRLMVLASEQLEGRGLIIVSGAAFMSNFEVQATIEDSGSEKNYSNYKICENLLSYLNPVVVTDIAEVQAQTEEGVKYTIEGIVTSNASGYDKETAFFDCIYLQDGTAGINAFPVAGNYKIGDKVRITGTTSSYQGERQIAVTSIELISEGNTVEPTVITASQLNDGSVLGSLVTLSGTVESFELANGLVQTIMVKDSEGNVGRVFIDGYITTSYDVENLAVGCEITVTGLASYDNSFDGPAPRIRVRDRKDVVCSASSVTVLASGWSGYTTWELTSDGVLTFSPSGQTYNGECNLKNYWKVNGVLTLPWGDYADQIVKVVIKDGIHDIGQMAFYELPNLQSIELGKDVTEVRNYAFKNCVSLTTADLSTITMFREGCFYGCVNLTDATFGTYFGLEDWAFYKTPFAYWHEW